MWVYIKNIVLNFSSFKASFFLFCFFAVYEVADSGFCIAVYGVVDSGYGMDIYKPVKVSTEIVIKNLEMLKFLIAL